MFNKIIGKSDQTQTSLYKLLLKVTKNFSETHINIMS